MKRRSSDELTTPVVVGGRPVPDAVVQIRDYVARHPATIRGADFLAGKVDVLDAGLIAATRAPLLGSRITRMEEGWLLSAGLPDVGPLPDREARLADADPEEEGGLYDEADACWRHLIAEAPEASLSRRRARSSTCFGRTCFRSLIAT